MEAQPRVLILTDSYGSGHARAASVPADEFGRAGALPTLVDLRLARERVS